MNYFFLTLGNPFTNFWDEYGIDFDNIHPLEEYYADKQRFMSR